MFEKTYAHSMLIAVDFFGALIIWNRPDITISSMCGITHRAAFETDPDGFWHIRLASMKLWHWQQRVLAWIAPRLGQQHCDGAIAADIERAHSVLDLLGAPVAK